MFSNFLKKILSSKITMFWRLFIHLINFFYHFFRFAFFGGWNANYRNNELRNYQLVKQYHSIEKTLSYSNRNSNFGWKSLNELMETLILTKSEKNIKLHDKIAVDTLLNFLELDENKSNPKTEIYLNTLKSLNIIDRRLNTDSIITLNNKDIERGILKDPYNFFYSRHSVREFKSIIVNKEIVHKAINLAIKTPSVCNRQPWHVYHTSDEYVIKQALSIQNGNLGFGHNIQNLLVVSSDLLAFRSGNEAYQHWIDGGMFSMSIIYALHSLGIASCCLNWSQTPMSDISFRKKLKIEKNHSIIMLIAFGYPLDKFSVCTSLRRNENEFISDLVVK